MIRDITIGQYFPVDSPLHRLDPRVKLSGTFLYIIALFIAKGFISYVVAALFLLFVIRLSKIPVRYMMKGMRSILVILLISVSFNLFLTPGTAVTTIPVLSYITWEGIRQACFMGARLILLLMGSTLMTLTTTPNQLTSGLEQGLRFLNIFRVPVAEIAMMMSIALRFIPILLEETDKIMKAQEARGADFHSGSLFQRARALVPLLVPLFISAFRRASDLALALEARCYHGGDHRTKMHPLQYTSHDRNAYIILFSFLAFMIFLRIVNG